MKGRTSERSWNIYRPGVGKWPKSWFWPDLENLGISNFHRGQNLRTDGTPLCSLKIVRLSSNLICKYSQVSNWRRRERWAITERVTRSHRLWCPKSTTFFNFFENFQKRSVDDHLNIFVCYQKLDSKHSESELSNEARIGSFGLV